MLPAGVGVFSSSSVHAVEFVDVYFSSSALGSPLSEFWEVTWNFTCLFVF